MLLEDFELVGELEDEVLNAVILKENEDLEEALKCDEGLVSDLLLER